MKKARKGFEFYVVFLTFAFCVLTCISGCGDSGREFAKDSLTGPKREVVITMWLIGSEWQALAVRDLAAAFYKKTGIRVKCDAMSWGDAHSKYLTSIAGGVAPDIGTMGLTWGAEFGSLGAMVDLQELYPAEVNAIRDSIFPGLWNSIAYKGKVYGVPFDMTEYVMYYRNDLIARPPQTWEELTKLLSDLNANSKSMIFDWGSMSWIGYSLFLWQAGGDYYDRNYTQITIDSPEAVAGMRFFADLYRTYNVPKTKIPLEQGMRTGDYPLAISGNWKIDSLRLSAPEIAGKWSIAMLPKGPTGRRTALIGGRIIGIFAQSKNKEAAWEFIKFLASPESQKTLYDAALAKQDTYLPPGRKAWDMLEMDPEFKRVLIGQAEDSKGPPPIAAWDANTYAIDEAIQKVILQGADPRTELGRAKESLARTLNK